MTKSKKLISLLMVILTLFSIVSIIPASAATTPNKYTVCIEKDPELPDLYYSTNGGLTYKKVTNTKLIFKVGDLVYFKTNNRECFMYKYVDSTGKLLTVDGYTIESTEPSPLAGVGASKHDIAEMGTVLHLKFEKTDIVCSKAEYNALLAFAVAIYPAMKVMVTVENLLGFNLPIV